MDAAAQVHAAFVPVRRAELGAEGGRLTLSSWSPAIDVCAVVTSDGQLAVHRMNWQQLWALAPEAPVTALAWRPDGKLLATGHADGSLAVWDVETGEPVARHPRAHFAPVTALDWSLTPAASGARIDRDGDRWSGAAVAVTVVGGNDDAAEADADAAPSSFHFNPAASCATAATYEDRQSRLFPADGLVLVSAQGGAPDTTKSKEDPYAELFRGAPPRLPRGSSAAANAAATATWDVQQQQQVASSSSSSPPLDLLCAADRRGCLSAWVGAGRVQVGDVAGLAPRVAVAVAAARGQEDDDGDASAAAAASAPPPPPPTLAALSTAADQSACVSVAWHPPPLPPAKNDDNDNDNDDNGTKTTTTTTTTTAFGLVAAPLAMRPLRAARREVRHWARLHCRLKGLLESASLALQSASREWASALQTLRKRVLGELAEALAAHSNDSAGMIEQGQDDEDNPDSSPRTELLLLLATGCADPAVHAWLTGSLGEAGVQRCARLVDAALERAHALLLHACLPALERAAFLLGELRGLAAATCPATVGGRGRGALLGLQPEALEPLEAAAVRAVVRAEQVRLATGRLAAQHRAFFTWLLRTARQLESASVSAAAAENNNDAAAANRPPPEPPAGPDAALADVLLPFLEEGGPLDADPLALELAGAGGALDEDARRAVARWLHCGGGEQGDKKEEDLGPEAVVNRVLRILYPPGRGGGGAGEAAAGAFAGGGGDDAAALFSLAGQVAALAEACEEALAAPQSSFSARLTVGRPIRLAPAHCFLQERDEQQTQPAPAPRVSVAPAGGVDGARGGEAGPNNDDGDADDGVVICVVVPAAGLAAIRPKQQQEEEEEEEEEEADAVLVVRARAVPAAAGSGSSSSPASASSSDPLELHLSAVLVRGDPGARVVDAAPYKDGQLAVLSSPASAGGRQAAAVTAPVLALLDLTSAPFAAVMGIPSSASADPDPTTITALEACLAKGAVVDSADLAAAGCVRAARLAGFAAAVAPLAVSRARGLALVLSDMQRLAVLDVDADEEGVAEEEE